MRDEAQVIKEPGEPRHEFFQRRLRELGMYHHDSDYDGMIGQAVEELSRVFARQGHSGMSAKLTVGLFNKLMDEWDAPPEARKDNVDGD